MMIYIGVSPVAFTIGPISVRWYGIMVALAIAVVILWMVWQVRKGAKLSYDTLLTAAVVAIPSGIVVSKLLHVIDNIVAAKLHPEMALSGQVIDYTQHPDLIVGAGGLSIYGAVLGATLGIWVYSKFGNFRFSYFADVIAPGIILAQTVGRVGCTLNSCCYGDPTSLFCAIVYTNPESYAPLGVAVHPTQIYEIVYNLIVFGVLLKLKGRFKPDGSLFLIYLSLYSLWRVGIDLIREGTPFLFGLHQAQVIGLVVLAITVPLLAYRTRWVSRRPGTQMIE